MPPAPSTIDLPALPPGMPPPGFFSPGPLPTPNFNTPVSPTPEVEIPKSPPPKPPSVILQQPPNNLIIPPLPSDFDRNIPPPPSLTPQFPPPANPGSLDEGEALEKLRDAQGRLPLFPDGAPVFTPEFPIGPRSSESGDRVPRLTQKIRIKGVNFPKLPKKLLEGSNLKPNSAACSRDNPVRDRLQVEETKSPLRVKDTLLCLKNSNELIAI
ncbi:MAG: hypothetical protein HC894_13255 [Microcoleus sp. SM1_3_4]|nr:hypothetical protein [Microcoleus sp. SM1_3_4]